MRRVCSSRCAPRRGATGNRRVEVAAYVDRALAEIAVLPVTPERERIRAFFLMVRADDLYFASDLPAARRDAGAARELAESVGIGRPSWTPRSSWP